MERIQATFSQRQPLFAESRDLSAIHSEDPFDLQSIVRSFSKLPPDIRRAAFTRVEGRLVDREILSKLTSQSAPTSELEDWDHRIRRRKAALTPQLGKLLFCVFIRLPGVHYTIEVDFESKQVVHWEWQAV